MNRRHAAVREHCGHGCCRLRLVHNVPRTLSAVYTDAFLTRFIVFHALMGFCVHPPRFPWQAHGMLFYCNNISSRVYFSCIWKIKKSGLPQWGGNDPPPPSSVTRCIRNDSILSLMLLQERGSISVLCFLLWSYFSPPHSSVNVSTPSVISQSIWPRNIIVTSCWGSTLNIWGITRPVFRLKIVVLVYIDFFFLVMLLEMQYLKFRFKLQKSVQELVNWANSCSLCHQLSTQEPLMITC